MLSSVKRAIGIDLGTSNSALCFIDESGETELLVPETGVLLGNQKGYPSVVAFNPKAGTLVGEPALRQFLTNPDNTFREFKRLIGKGPQSSLGGYDPVELSRILLAKMKGDAERYAGVSFPTVVITVPAYFNDGQREATKQAAIQAGFTKVTLLNEPTAAAIAYGFTKTTEQKRVFVFDLGGGTLDFTVLDVDPENDIYDVIGTYGDNFIGGKDVDNVLIKYLVKNIKQENPEFANFEDNPKCMAAIKQAAETAKVQLSSSPIGNVSIELFNKGEAISYTEELSLSTFSHLISKFVQTCEQLTKKALETVSLKTSDIDELILIGGPTKIVAVREMLTNLFGKPPLQNIDPMNAVSIGAAIKSGSIVGGIKNLEAGGIIDLDVIPLSIGIGLVTGEFSIIVPRNSKIPTDLSNVYTNAQDNQYKILIEIYQGERSVAAANHFLGQFSIDIDPVPAHTAQIEVKFSIDSEGITTVSAYDKIGGNSAKYVLQKPHEYSKEEIAKKIKESEEMVETDNSKLSLNKSLESVKTKMLALNQLNSSTGNCSSSECKNLQEELNTLLSKISEALKSPNNEVATTLDSETRQLVSKVTDFIQKSSGGNSSGQNNIPETETETEIVTEGDNTNSQIENKFDDTEGQKDFSVE